MKQFDKVHEVLQEGFNVLMEMENQVTNPYTRVEYFCHIVDDVFYYLSSEGVPEEYEELYKMTKEYILSTLNGEDVYVNYLLKKDIDFACLYDKAYQSPEDYAESRRYLLKAKVQWIKDMIEECKANDY